MSDDESPADTSSLEKSFWTDVDRFVYNVSGMPYSKFVEDISESMGHKIHVNAYNERFMKDYCSSVPAKNKRNTVFFQKGGVGTGKSTTFESWIKEFETLCHNKGYSQCRILIVTCRRTLCQFKLSCLKKYGFESYMDISGPIDHVSHPKVIIQSQSLR